MESIKSLSVQIALVIIISVGSSAIATKITLSVIETKMVYVESDIITIKQILDTVTKHQVVLAERGVWISSVNRRLDSLEKCINTKECAK